MPRPANLADAPLFDQVGLPVDSQSTLLGCLGSIIDNTRIKSNAEPDWLSLEIENGDQHGLPLCVDTSVRLRTHAEQVNSGRRPPGWPVSSPGPARRGKSPPATNTRPVDGSLRPGME